MRKLLLLMVPVIAFSFSNISIADEQQKRLTFKEKMAIQKAEKEQKRKEIEANGGSSFGNSMSSMFGSISSMGSSISDSISGTVTETTGSEESYSIYKIQRNGLNGKQLSNLIIEGLKHDTTGVQARKLIPPFPMPSEPARFTTRNIGNQTIPRCDGAVLFAQGHRSMSGQPETINMTVCLFPSRGDYELDIFTNFTKQEGASVLGAMFGRAIVGDSSNHIKTITQKIIASIEKNGAAVKLIESYPE